METKTTWVQVRVTPEEKKQILELTRVTGETASDIVREELQKRIAEEGINKDMAVAK